jgi:hypothetical protein
VGRISFRIPVHPRDPLPSGDGDIEGAFVRAGFSPYDASQFYEALLEAHGGFGLKTSALRRAGVDVTLMAGCLRAAGLIVEVKEDNPEDYRPAGKFNKAGSGD